MPADITVECDSVPNTPALESLTASDNCDEDVTVSYDGEVRNDGACPDSYTLTRTWTATDDCGNSIQHQQVVTVQDTTPPQITCPDDITIESGEPTDPSNTGQATATDNCDPSPTVDHDDTTIEAGITRTWTATDACGNSSQCVQTITIVTPPPPRPGGGGGVPAITRCYLDVDMLDEITTLRLTCCSNETYKDYLPTDPDEVHLLVIEDGTPIFCGEYPGCGNYPEIIVMSMVDDPPLPPEDMTIIGPAYDFTGYWDEDMLEPCSQVTFGLPCTLILSYDPDELPEGAFSPVVAYYDEEEGVWVILPPDTGRVAEVGQVTGLLERLSLFTVMAELPPPPPPPPPPPVPSLPPPPPPPAHFVVSDLTIVPSLEKIEWGILTFVVRKGGSVTVTSNVGNDGGQEGSYVANLNINGQTRGTEEITLSPEQSQTIVFSILDNEPGYYVVEIAGLSGEFHALVWINWWLIGGLTAAFILVVWVAWYYGYHRRRLKGR
jgi:hypothetical protein